MEAVTRYCTTDLDLYSPENPTDLAAAFEYDEPEPHLAAMLTVIEGLDPASRTA